MKLDLKNPKHKWIVIITAAALIILIATVAFAFLNNTSGPNSATQAPPRYRAVTNICPEVDTSPLNEIGRVISSNPEEPTSGLMLAECTIELKALKEPDGDKRKAGDDNYQVKIAARFSEETEEKITENRQIWDAAWIRSDSKVSETVKDFVAVNKLDIGEDSYSKRTLIGSDEFASIIYKENAISQNLILSIELIGTTRNSVSGDEFNGYVHQMLINTMSKLKK